MMNPQTLLNGASLLVGVVVVTVAPAWAAVPAWVGQGARAVDAQKYMAGYAVSFEGDIAEAKAKAAADLAQQIVVRVTQTIQDVTLEKDGEVAYEIAAVTALSTDVELSRLDYRTHRTGNRAYALALLERARAAADRREARDLKLEQLSGCLEAKRVDSSPVARLRRLLRCRRTLLEAHDLGAQAMAIAAEPTPADRRASSTLFKLAARLESALERIDPKPAQAPDELAQILVLQLAQQDALTRGAWTIEPLSYGSTPFTSAFGRGISQDIERELARASRGQPPHEGKRVLSGTYHTADELISVSVTIRAQAKQTLLAGAKARLKRSKVPVFWPLAPDNAAAALANQKLLAANVEMSSGLTLEAWTKKGRTRLVFEEGEELRLFLRVNQPAYVRLIYILANGTRVQLDADFFIGPKQVSRAVEYPSTFVVTPPFGVEHLFAVAFSRRPRALETESRSVAGETYDVIIDRTSMVRHRGRMRSQAGETDEALIVLTTVQGSAPTRPRD